MIKLIAGLMALATIIAPAKPLEPVVRYAEEPPVVETPTETPFEQTTYKGYFGKDQESAEYEFEVVLATPTRCFLKAIYWFNKAENRYETETKECEYYLQDKLLVVYTGDFDIYFQILEGNVINCVDVQENVVPTPPVEPEWEVITYKITIKDKVYLLHLVDESHYELYCVDNDQESVAKGFYIILGKTIVIDRNDLGAYTFEIDSENLTLTPNITKDDDGKLHFKTQWVENAWRFLNEPLPVIGFSILAIGMWILIFIAKTSFGKKNIKKLNAKAEETEKEYKEYREQTDKIIAEYDKRNAEMQNQLDSYKNTLIDICSTSRNAKVKEIKKGLENGKETEEREETTNNSTEEKAL